MVSWLERFHYSLLSRFNVVLWYTFASFKSVTFRYYLVSVNCNCLQVAFIRMALNIHCSTTVEGRPLVNKTRTASDVLGAYTF